MKNGVINHKVEPSEEMMVKKRNYIADNVTDYLKDYIQSNIKQNVEPTPNSKRGNWCIKRDDFRRGYNDMLLMMLLYLSIYISIFCWNRKKEFIKK